MSQGQASFRDVDAVLLQQAIAAVTEEDGIMSFMLGAHGKYFKLGVNYGGVWTNPNGETVEAIEHKLRREISRAEVRRSA